MLDITSAAVLSGVAGELLGQAYFLRVVPEAQRLAERGESFYTLHVKECVRLQRIAQFDLVGFVAQSPVRSLFDRASQAGTASETPRMTLEDLRKYETDFTAVTGKFKDLDAPGEDLEALRKKSATYSRAYHNFWTAVLAGLGGLTFAIVWGAASGGGPAGAALVSVFGIIALTGGLATAASADEYFRLRTDVPKIEERLNQAFHKKVYFADESPPPKEVPEKATPER